MYVVYVCTRMHVCSYTLAIAHVWMPKKSTVCLLVLAVHLGWDRVSFVDHYCGYQARWLESIWEFSCLHPARGTPAL